MIKNTFLLVLAVSLLLFSSCIDLNEDKETQVDALIFTKILGSDTIYAIGGYVSSNTTMKSATMKSANGSGSFELKKSSYAYYFELPLDDSIYMTQKPVAGDYKFEIVYEDGTTDLKTDYVSSEVIEPIEIKSVKPDSVDNSIVVEWVKNKNADYYTLSLFRNDSVVYFLDKIDPGYSSVEIFDRTSNWYTNNNTSSGDTLQVQVSGILLENGNSQYYEFQSLSYSLKKDVVWPE